LDLAIGTAVHEFAHILGITSDDFLFYYDWTTGLPRTPDPKKLKIQCVNEEIEELFMPGESTLKAQYSKSAGAHYEIVTPTVVQVVRNHFNCQKLTGARLENQPTSDDCFGSHFDERLYFTESMSPVLGAVPEVLTSLTLALLQDSGWYKPNYSVAGVSSFGHGAGCAFVEEKCIVDGKVPDYSKDMFCNAEVKYAHTNFVGTYGCDPTFTHLAMCDLIHYDSLPQYDPPPTIFQYFDDKKFGSLMGKADFCPTYSLSAVSCQNIILENAKLPSLGLGFESDSPSSRCFTTDGLRPICLDTSCNSTINKITVYIGNNTYVCKYDGQKILLPNSSTRFECPKKAVMCPDLICPANCAGRGICDYTLEDPKCTCFHKDDKSPGCTNEIITVPPKGAWASDAAHIHGHGWILAVTFWVIIYIRL